MLAYDQSGEIVSLKESGVERRFASYRQPLHDGKISLLDVCEAEELKLAVDQIHFYNRFITPIGRPRRFDTRFFIAAAPEAQRGIHDEQETVDSIWITPTEALRRNDVKDFDLMTVTRIQLEWLTKYINKAGVLDAASNQKEFLVRRPSAISPGI